MVMLVNTMVELSTGKFVVMLVTVGTYLVFTTLGYFYIQY